MGYGEAIGACVSKFIDTALSIIDWVIFEVISAID